MTRYRLPRAALVAAACAAVLAACSDPGVIAAGAGTISLINTDKTLVDHIASLGPEDCSTVRFSLGDEWCLPDDEGMIAPLPAQTKYCYRTLGQVSCYAEPSPHPHDTLVGIVVPRTRGLNSQ